MQDLSNLYRKIAKMCPEMTVAFVSSLMRSCFSNLSNMPFVDVEVSLYLLGLLSEASSRVGKGGLIIFSCITCFFGLLIIHFIQLCLCRFTFFLRDASCSYFLWSISCSTTHSFLFAHLARADTHTPLKMFGNTRTGRSSSQL